MWTLTALDRRVTEFVIRYEVGGQVFWDSNNSQNYTMELGKPVLGNGLNVIMDGWTFSRVVPASPYWPYRAASFSGNVLVRNIAYNKAVTIVYSTDNRVTTRTLPAMYDLTWGDTGLERWSFRIELGDATRVEFAVSFDAGGNTWWDNNYGLNYRSN